MSLSWCETLSGVEDRFGYRISVDDVALWMNKTPQQQKMTSVANPELEASSKPALSRE
jgi:hypothetical protein